MTAGPAPVRAAGHRRTPRVLAVLLALLLLLFSAITITQSAAAHRISPGTFNSGAGLLLTLWVIAAVGLVVAWHQPGNPIGWLLLAAPASLAVTFASDGYDAAYQAGQHTLPVLGPAALIFAQLFYFPFIAFPLIIWLFPDGRLPPGRWKWVFWISLGLCVPGLLTVLGITIAAEAGHHVHVLSDGQLAQVENPPSPVLGGLTLLFFFGLLARLAERAGLADRQLAPVLRGAPPAAEMADERGRRLRRVRYRLIQQQRFPVGNTDHRHHRTAGVDRDRHPEVPAV